MLKNRCTSNRACVSKAVLLAPRVAGAVLVVLSVLLSVSNAAAQSTTVEFNIPAQPISSALRAYAQQAEVQLIVLTEGLNLIQANAVVGHLSPRTALQMLLAGTGLQAEYRADASVAVKRRSDTTGVARLEGETGNGTNPIKGTLEEILVIGTNIRGIAPESSPTRTFTRDDIQMSGAATAQDFIQTLTTNFGGGSNENILILPNDTLAGFNGQLGTFGSSVNLRGLGSGSTLVLLNGHRVAPSSGIGDFTDISMIPASALERVETLTDGASSIHGADAVAGVVNFVLRDDYDGVETSLRYGTVTEGDMDEYRAGITSGKSWSSGNAFATYEFFRQTNLSAGDRSFSQDALLPNDLLPSQRRHTILAAASQEVAPTVRLSTDLLFSDRDSENATSSFAVNEGSPVFRTPSTQNLSVSAGGSWNISDTWFMDSSSTYSKVKQDVINRGSLNSTRDVDSGLWTVDAKFSGTLFSSPGGDVKLAAGGHYRSESFTSIRLRPETDTIERQAERDVYAAFLEAFVPIVGAGNSQPGIRRLEINASMRYADFSDFGYAANPKVGLLWSPFSKLNLRATYGTSFNPPPLGLVGASDLSVNSYPSALINSLLGLTPADPSIADIVIISVNGTAKNLVSEESSAFTGGFDFSKQQGRHHFAVSSTYFDIEYQNRLGRTPVPGNVTSFDVPNIWFNSPDAFPPGTVTFPATTEEINELLERVDTINRVFGTDPRDAEMIVISAVIRNLSLTFTRGFDFETTYSYDADFGELLIGLDGTYLLDFQRQAAASSPIVEQVNTQFNPVDLRLRGRAGFTHAGFSANVFVNYANSYHVDSTPDAVPIDSWTTADLSLSYDTQESLADTILENTELRLSVVNLLDEDPPATELAEIGSVSGYDPTNASPLGRFIALQLTKRF